MDTSTASPPSMGFIKTPLSNPHMTLPLQRLSVVALAPAANWGVCRVGEEGEDVVWRDHVYQGPHAMA
eukprot:scaffold84752_cov31-Tisochrysis_lutea.AAC.1